MLICLAAPLPEPPSSAPLETRTMTCHGPGNGVTCLLTCTFLHTLTPATLLPLPPGSSSLTCSPGISSCVSCPRNPPLNPLLSPLPPVVGHVACSSLEVPVMRLLGWRRKPQLGGGGPGPCPPQQCGEWRSESRQHPLPIVPLSLCLLTFVCLTSTVFTPPFHVDVEFLHVFVF